MKQEDINKLVEMYNKELPFSFIAKELGVSRSTISGYADRLRKRGVIKPLKSSKKLEKVVEKRRKYFNPKGYTGVISHLLSKKKSPDKVIEWDYKPLGAPVNIMGLTNKTCRFPCTGDLYCGAGVHKNGYCEEHYKLCWRVVPKKEMAYESSSSLPH